MNDALVSQGSVLWVDFDPTLGSEQAGLRPAVVVSSDTYNAVIPNLLIVVPATTRDRKLPHHVTLAGRELRLPQTSFAMTEQPKTIDRRRIRRGAGRVDQSTLAEIERWLGDHFGFRGSV